MSCRWPCVLFFSATISFLAAMPSRSNSNPSRHLRHVFLLQPADLPGGIADLQPIAVAPQHHHFRSVMRGEGTLRFFQRAAPRDGLGNYDDGGLLQQPLVDG